MYLFLSATYLVYLLVQPKQIKNVEKQTVLVSFRS